MKNYFKLLQFLKGHRKRFFTAIIFILLSSTFEGVQLTLILPVIDRIFTNKKIVVPNQVPHFINQIVNYFNAVDTLFGFSTQYHWLFGDAATADYYNLIRLDPSGIGQSRNHSIAASSEFRLLSFRRLRQFPRWET